MANGRIHKREGITEIYYLSYMDKFFSRYYISSKADFLVSLAGDEATVVIPLPPFFCLFTFHSIIVRY